MDFSMQLIIGFLAFLAVVKGVKFVPQQQVWIVERMGRYRMSMQAGINFLIPFIDRGSRRHPQPDSYHQRQCYFDHRRNTLPENN